MDCALEKHTVWLGEDRHPHAAELLAPHIILPAPFLRCTFPSKNEGLTLTGTALRKQHALTNEIPGHTSKVSQRDSSVPYWQLTPHLAHSGCLIKHSNSYPIGTRIGYHGESLVPEEAGPGLHPPTTPTPRHGSEAGPASKATQRFRLSLNGLTLTQHPARGLIWLLLLTQAIMFLLSCAFCSSNRREPCPPPSTLLRAAMPTWPFVP